MPNTYTLLETISVGAAGASSVTFNSIPQTGYTDLVVKGSARSLSASTFANITISFNGSAANYTLKWLGYSNGSAISADRSGFGANQLAYTAGATATANTFANFEFYIPNYTSANYKSISVDGVNENNSSTTYFGLSAGLWSQTAAITSLTLSDGNTISQYSTFSLYGVSALGTTPTKAPKATGGSIIQTDGTYWYHAFLSSGTFTPATALSCDVLVVAGGGGGGGNKGGGGGAGGVSYLTSSSMSTAKTVTIGGGGTAGAGIGGSGSNSVFDNITSNGGGGGGSDANRNGITGGSGGGASRDGSIGSANQGSTGGATGYGFAGGLGLNATWFGGGGGGGAGAVGQNMPSSAGGAGGAGLNTWSTWLSTTGLGVSGYIAGGGGGGIYSGSGTQSGGVGGAGGGGNGGNNVNGTQTIAPVIGTANTGSGGGGGGDVANGAAGGSGIVIVRYLA